MVKVTVLPLTDVVTKPGTPLMKVMCDRLVSKAAELEHFLSLELSFSADSEDLVIYMSYNSKYAIRWKIVNDVPLIFHEIVAGKCAKLGYIQWIELDLYGFESRRLI